MERPTGGDDVSSLTGDLSSVSQILKNTIPRPRPFVIWTVICLCPAKLPILKLALLFRGNFCLI